MTIIAPYVLVDGRSGKTVGLNKVGLKRHGFSSSDILQIKQAYRLIFQGGLAWDEMLLRLATDFPTGPAARFHDFLTGGKRRLTRERRERKILRTETPSADYP